MKGLANQTVQVVVFNLAEQMYGVEISSVLEIIQPEALTRVPGSPDFIEGIIKLRGQVIPVLDLARRFGLHFSGPARESRKIIVVETDGTKVGMIVDGVSEVRRFSGEQVQPPPEIVAGPATAYLQGIVLTDGQLIILFDVRRVLCAEEKTALAEIAG